MTDHVFELAPSGRSKCRSCGLSIAKDDLRFGESMDNPFGEGNMVQWHHPACAAHRRPEALLEAIDVYDGQDKDELQTTAERISSNRRLQRIGKLEQASSGRARCRHCKELIEKDDLRVPLVFFEEGTYSNSGFVHVTCLNDYCEGGEVWPTLAQFAIDADEEMLELADSFVN